MLPLRIEAYRGDLRRWVHIGEIKPHDPAGTLSSNLPDGTREIYQFYCAKDDSHSVIQKLPLGTYVEVGRQIRLLDPENVKNASRVATLRKGDPSYSLTIKTDINPQRRIIRFTHK